MSVSPSSRSSRFTSEHISAVVSRLRAAGCVFAEDEARLLCEAARTPGELDAMTARRADGLPLEHVVGWAEFDGLRVAVDPGVFVPRRRTEFLVRRAVELAPVEPAPAGPVPAGPVPTPPPGVSPLVVVDLCCGSGAVGAALARALGPRTELHAADIDPAAVRCARRNLAAAGAAAEAGVAGGRVYEGDLFAPLPRALRGRVGVLTANVPYVPSEDIALLPAEAREHEARLALDGGADGLDVLRRVAAPAAGWLRPGGCLLVETSERQAEAAAAVLTDAGLVPDVAADEDLGATVLSGTRR